MPKVSAIIATCGRFPDFGHLLNESVFSVLNQTMQDFQLLVVNDCPVQKLICDDKRVEIINLSHRANSLGEKLNLAFALTSSDVLCYVDDDDLWRPKHLENSLAKLGSRAYYNPRHGFFYTPQGMRSDHTHGVLHNASVFTREAFNKVGGYAHISGSQDMEMDSRLRATVDTFDDMALPKDQWTGIYRWGVSPVHLSGTNDYARAWKDYGNRAFAPGEFLIEPQWKQDYEAMCLKCI